MNKKLLSFFRCNQKIQEMEEGADCLELIQSACQSRNKTGRVKTHLELNLIKDVKDDKKGFFKYINNKRKT